MQRIALALALASFGCGSSDRPPQTATEERTDELPEAAQDEAPPPAREVRDGLFAAEGSPDPRACETEADCIGDTIADVRQPCCNDPRTLQAYSAAYRAWLQTWRASHCEDVTCPPPPPPAPPPSCAFEMRCVDGRCANRCE